MCLQLKVALGVIHTFQSYPSVVCEQLPRRWLINDFLCEPVTKTHHKGTLNLADINIWIDAAQKMEKMRKSNSLYPLLYCNFIQKELLSSKASVLIVTKNRHTFRNLFFFMY